MKNKTILEYYLFLLEIDSIQSLEAELQKARKSFIDIKRKLDQAEVNYHTKKISKEEYDRINNMAKEAGTRFNTAKERLNNFKRYGNTSGTNRYYSGWSSAEQEILRRRSTEIHKRINRKMFIIISVYMLLLIAHELYQEAKRNEELKCKFIFDKKKKEICLINAKINGLKKKHESLSKSLSRCDKTNDPKNCKDRVRKEIKKTILKIKELEERAEKIKRESK